MQDKARAPSSSLRPSQASAADLVAGGSQIAIPAKQPLGELTQDPVTEYALSASPAQIDSEEIRLMHRAAQNHRIFPPEGITECEGTSAATASSGPPSHASKAHTPPRRNSSPNRPPEAGARPAPFTTTSSSNTSRQESGCTTSMRETSSPSKACLSIEVDGIQPHQHPHNEHLIPPPPANHPPPLPRISNPTEVPFFFDRRQSSSTAFLCPRVHPAHLLRLKNLRSPGMISPWDRRRVA